MSEPETPRMKYIEDTPSCYYHDFRAKYMPKKEPFWVMLRKKTKFFGMPFYTGERVAESLMAKATRHAENTKPATASGYSWIILARSGIFDRKMLKTISRLRWYSRSGVRKNGFAGKEAEANLTHLLARIVQFSPNEDMDAAARDSKMNLEHFGKWMSMPKRHLQLPQKAAEEFELRPQISIMTFDPEGDSAGHLEAPMLLDIYHKETGKRLAGAGFFIYNRGTQFRPEITMRITNLQGQKIGNSQKKIRRQIPRFSSKVEEKDWRPFLIRRLEGYAKEQGWQVEGTPPWKAGLSCAETTHTRNVKAYHAAYEAAGFKLGKNGEYRPRR